MAGQPFGIRPAGIRALDVARVEAGREEVKSAIPEAESAVALARSQLDLAQVTFNRMQDLLNKRSITNQEYDEASARLKAAQAALDTARAKRTQLDAKMAQIEQEVRAAGIQRGYSEIIAPFSGTIITKSIDPGTLAVPGAPLFTIERDGAYHQGTVWPWLLGSYVDHIEDAGAFPIGATGGAGALDHFVARVCQLNIDLDSWMASRSLLWVSLPRWNGRGSQ